MYSDFLVDDFTINEPEISLFKILDPWCKKVEEETGHCANFTLTWAENQELGESIYEKDATYGFYTFEGRVYVISNGYADANFAGYPKPFQKKAYEIIKNKYEERKTRTF